uniref:AAA+ ATPase domain-containing protein n=1 Tax=Oryza brachyantha TaxID=4533 RepID=J3N960_ORYBR
MDGIACISGPSGSGKTELVLEYAHRHAMEYKKVLWVCGEARYLRMGYLKLADQLGLAVGDDLSLIAAGDRSSSGRKEWVFRGIEGDAIAKIKKELSREIPYLLVIDNLESETDWWDSRDVHELLPGVVAGAAARSHVIITTTRLHRLQRVRTFSLAPSLAAEEAMLLMTNKGALEFCGEDAIALRSIEQKVRGVPLALALVGAILSELAVEPAELRRAMNDASYRAPTWEEADEPALRDNPGLVQLLDVCFALLDEEKDGLGAAAARMVETSGFFGPSPIPEHAEHAWEACLSVFKFAPAGAIDLPTKELPQFVTRLAVPLTAHGVTAYSSYAAVTDLLVEAADAVRAEEERFVASGSVNLDPPLYHELALSRAELMKMRAKLMLRGGEFTLAENHILTAITILDVVSGDDHPETLAARATLDHILQVQPE